MRHAQERDSSVGLPRRLERVMMLLPTVGAKALGGAPDGLTRELQRVSKAIRDRTCYTLFGGW